MIKLENVSYTYMPGGPFEKTAVHNIDLTVPDGQFIGLIGHTGSGKSTLIQLMNGLLKPTEGRILIDGQELFSKDVKMRDIRFKVGLVMQYPEYQLFEETVEKEIAYGPSNMGLSEDEIKSRICYAADLVGIPDEMLKKSPFELSGGQKRRVAIAGIVAMQPTTLILDEPTAGLDPKGREEILFKIKDLQRRMNITVILVSHSMEDIAQMADRILVMNKGELSMNETPQQVFARGDELAKMGLDLPQITKICNDLIKAGYPIRKGIYTVSEAVEEIKRLKFV
ncbi:MAG: energy-coupling factor transporter ATPase [Ruminococcaceae bacterium]|nr:energy-coupling factor transporter ATPase [Oscillospiraceae bacterium]